MAATTTKSNIFTSDHDAATERVRETTDRMTDAGRKVTNAYLDGIEKYAADFAKFERKLVEQSQIDGLAGLLDTHAKLTEEFVTATVTAARDLIAV